MVNDEWAPRELSGLVVPQCGSLQPTSDPFAPFRLLTGPVSRWPRASVFFAELSACGRPATTHRSYGMALLRWFRFLWAVGVDGDEATRVEARDSADGSRSRTSGRGRIGEPGTETRGSR